MVRIVVTWLGTFASVAGLAVALWPETGMISATQGAVLGIVAAVLLAGVSADFIQYMRHRPKRYKTARQINDYMYRWISTGGRVVIFTRDMSWANEPRIKDLLLNKARSEELTICLPDPIPLSQELEAAGASIATYAGVGHVPLSRFTIINADRMDAHVAIGRRIKNRHVIEEYSAGSHPVFAVAKDLVEIVRRVSVPAGENR